MRRYEAWERAIKQREGVALKHALDEFGIQLRVYKQKVDKTSRVYGVESGEIEEEQFEDIVGIVTSDDFFTTGPSVSGGFQEGWLYTNSDKVEVGRILEIPSVDGKSRRHKITSKEDLGMTQEIFVRWKLAALGD